MVKYNFNKVALQLYLNHTSVRVLSRKLFLLTAMFHWVLNMPTGFTY